MIFVRHFRCGLRIVGRYVSNRDSDLVEISRSIGMASDSDLDLKFLITILMMKMKSKPDLPRGQNYAV